ncbi:hypothetical protein [Megamonas hypermegale]|uniref:hypothetical protein n=1 Tax=Megamonas hypermegale TaxID=158847 RepID=UPI00242AA4B3|nr:hypothetical protein [Megamonas hypermegale]
MDILLACLYFVGGIVAVVATIVIGYGIFLLGCNLIRYTFMLLVDIAYMVIRFPFYVLMHPVKLCTNTKIFFKDFSLKIPYLGENARFKIDMKKERAEWEKLTSEQKHARVISFRRNQEELKEYMEHESYMKNKYGKNWQEKFF